MKLRSLRSIFALVFLVTFATSSLASVRMEFCNENEFDIRWAFTALNGGLFGTSNSLEDAVGFWGDGFYVAQAGECKTSGFVIGADRVYFVFMTLDEEPRFFKLSLDGIKNVNDEHPLSEMCIPIDGQHFYYQPEAANYKNDKIIRCPSKVSRSGSDYFESATPREMGIAQISTGIRVKGEIFLTVTIPKLDDPVTYKLKGAEIAAEPEIILPHELYVRTMRQVRGVNINYGASVTVNLSQHADFGFDVGGKLFVYTLLENGNLEFQSDPKSKKLAISSNKLRDILNQGHRFEMQRVVVEGTHQGFFVFNPFAAQGFYLDATAIDRNKMDADLKGRVFAKIEDG